MAFSTPQIDVDLQVRTELKEVTVLFADIENSTRLIESMDPERASAALDPIIGIMVETVRSFGGTVARIVGDGIMAIFGAPVSLEGHAVQACFAGLEITEKVKKRSLTADDKINVRVGIDSGQVLVRTYGTDLSVSYDAVGLIVHMASKIEKLAATNTVALSRRTEQQARGFISTVSISHVALNHANHEVLKLTGRALPGKSMARNCRTLCDLINHTECFEQLRTAEATLFDGRGCSVMLEGDAGVGKSRIVSEFVKQIPDEKASLIRIEGVLHGDRTLFQPFHELLIEHLRIGTQESQTEIDSRINKMLARYRLSNHNHQLALCSLFNPAISDPKWNAADPDWRRRAVIDALIEVIRAMARETPLVFVAEDIHWMDQGSIAVISTLAQQAARSRILFLITQRPDRVPSISHHQVDHYLRVNRLGRQDTLSMCLALLGHDEALKPLARQLVERTEGVPLFLEELVLNLVESGAIKGEVGSMSVGSGGELIEARLPSTITAILASRIDRLPKSAHDLLEVACVIGGRFPTKLLKLAASLDDANFHERVNALLESRLIFDTGDEPGDHYSFSHALAREVCYQSMVTAKRRRRHATIAAAMREFYGARIQEYTEELAHHLTKAGAYTDAIEQWQRAAQRALMNAANAEAVEALETAIGLLAHLPDDPVHLRKGLELQSLLGSVLIVARGPGSPEVEKVYDECRRLATELGEAQALFRSIWGQWRIAWKVPNKIAIARQLNEIADKHSEIEFRIQAHHAQWASCYNGGELRQCLGHITDGLASYDERLHGELLLHYGGHDPAVCGYGEAALCHWILGDPALGAKMAQSAIDQALRLKHAGSIGHAYDYALFYLQHSGNPREALQTAKKAIKFADEMGLPHYAARARAWRGWAISQIDSVVDGIAQMEAAVAEQRQTGVEEDFPVFLEVLAGLEAGIGRYDVAHARCQEALDLTRTSGMRHWLAEIMRREAVVRAKLVPDKLDACIASLVEARAVAEKQQAVAIEARISADLRRLDERKELRNILPDLGPVGVAPHQGDHREMRT